MENDRRTHGITFRMNDEEYKIFQHKLEIAKAKSQGEFIRKMLMNGVVLYLDQKKYRSMIKSVSGVAANINQIAVRVNSTGSIYADEVTEIQKDINELWRQLRLFQSDLQKLTQ